jgi:hypothetical protein
MASITFNNFKHYATMLESELGIKYDAKPAKETIRIMLDGYCKAIDEDDEYLKNLYISGLILRHWDKVKKLAETCPNIDLKGDEFYEWVYEAIVYACKYRKWQIDPNVNAQQCINMCIETIRKQHYYEYNLDKHSANYNTVSMSTPVCDESDNGVQKTLEDTISDKGSDLEARKVADEVEVRQLVQKCINKSRLVEAIILDIIAFGDPYKVVKHTKTRVDENGESHKYTSTTRTFWKFKAVQLLSTLPDNFMDYFLDNYKVNSNALTEAVDLLKRANNSKLYRELDKSLQFVKSTLTRSI